MINSIHRSTLVVVGTGMAGARVVEEVLARDPHHFQIRMFGAEPHGTYNRILLSTVLGGFQDPSALWLNPREWYDERGIHLHAGVRAEQIDPQRRVVVGARGNVEEPYDYLVLATGSRPFVPPLEGANKRGAFVFRTLEDCEAIATYAHGCDRAVILGGGLLGLEAARGLVSHGLDVTVIEVAPHLMPQQLDITGGALLRRKIEAMGIEVRVGDRVTGLAGEERVTGVRLAAGTVLDTDMVVISCGIRPNVDEARAAGLLVDRGIVVDDQLRTSEPEVFAVGECAQHRGRMYGLVDPIYEQVRVLADVLTGQNPEARYRGSRLTATLKVMGVDLVSMGEVSAGEGDCEVISHLDTDRGIYKKFLLRDRRLTGAILLGTADVGGRLTRLFKSDEPLDGSPLELLAGGARDALLEQGGGASLLDLPDDTQICNCNTVCKGDLVKAIRDGKTTLPALGECTRAGTGCGTCQPLLAQLIDACIGLSGPPKKNKIELLKENKDGLDILDEIRSLMEHNRWQEMTEDQQHLAKWHGLFFRKPTPGHFMLRLRFNAGQGNARQLRVIADLCDQFGRGFCDLTTRQQIQLRWFTLADVEEIWRRLAEVGLHTRQTGMDNVRGICGCPAAGLTPHELLDATPVINEFNALIVDNREFTNLPRKFNVTITGCMENCCHPETQDIALVPAYRHLDGEQVNGFNVLVGGKQGSGGYTPATQLDVFAPPADAARLCAEITRLFRDHGARESRTRARLAFLIQDRGIAWFRTELQKRWPGLLHRAGTDMRKKHHTDHLGLHPQKHSSSAEKQLFSAGLMVPVGRITSTQLRAVADLAERYGSGALRVTVGQNIVIVNIPEDRLGAFTQEPLLQELPFDPSPIMRGLVVCTGNDYCGLALIDTKRHALEIARELERRTEGKKLQPLTVHWSGCPAGCGLHQVATIGLQGCRSRVNGEVVDSAHVYVNGKTGPTPRVATDVMYDVPVAGLADALENLVNYLPRS
jgi:nitrite reductase (NADH) large subunit